MARLYTDENIPRLVVDVLRQLGHDVLTIYEDGKGNQRYPDGSVLDRASETGRAIVTINRRDFRRLHLHHPNHAGIILCTYDPDFTGQAQRIHDALDRYESLACELIRVYRPD